MVLNFNYIPKQHWLLAISYWLSALFLTSCQKVINIDLNSSAPTIVIEGNINDQPGPYIVTVSRTVNFNQPDTFPPISAAFITIADNHRHTDTLVESSPGVYSTTKITGSPGRTYTLKVITNGKTYTAISTMPMAVTFDTLTPFSQVGFRDTNLYVSAGFKDPSKQTNYYRFREAINYTVKPSIFVTDDQYENGRYINYVLKSDSSLKSGDVVIVEMQCIDEATYQYFNTFNEASGATNLTPANPASNISNNALGYFSAHTSRYKGLVIP